MVSARVVSEKIEETRQGWLRRARERTATFKALGAYRERRSIWSEVKPVFMDIQHQKCCFCERKFEAGSLGRHELDLEHFRPKATVRPTPLAYQGPQTTPTSPPPRNGGYYLLAYNVLNYTVACKPCNSGLKRNYFPILGDYDLVGEDPEAMMSERPMLIYPIGSYDIDPEEAISFYGVTPRSVSEDPDVRRRGQAVIAFFRLDDVEGRRNLFRERAIVIVLLDAKLRTAGDDSALIDTLTSSSAPHANCARSFVRLFEADSAKAARVAKAAHDFVTSKS